MTCSSFCTTILHVLLWWELIRLLPLWSETNQIWLPGNVFKNSTQAFSVVTFWKVCPIKTLKNNYLIKKIGIANYANSEKAMKNLGILLLKQKIHLTIRNCNILGVAYATECPLYALCLSDGHSLHYANTFPTSIESECIHETNLWPMELDRNVVLKFKKIASILCLWTLPHFAYDGLD